MSRNPGLYPPGFAPQVPSYNRQPPTQPYSAPYRNELGDFPQSQPYATAIQGHNGQNVPLPAEYVRNPPQYQGNNQQYNQQPRNSNYAPGYNNDRAPVGYRRENGELRYYVRSPNDPPPPLPQQYYSPPPNPQDGRR